ncbi:MAG: Gfo/Idh/MocA family oxidoreductase, partial [archaeon]|nr:Gfo/Idh/MocA family oxidoreductase [archaeon]
MNIGLKNGPVTAVMNGAGARGREIYGKYALKTPDRLKFIAIADPDVARRKLFQEEHDIEDHMAYDSWDKMMNESIGKIAEAAFICTQDQMHYEPAVRALELGYNVILEKPISPSIDECQKLERLAKEKGSTVQVCHVLRFTDFWLKIKEIVDSGKIGKIIHYDHSENVAYWHYGHSYTRG